MPGGILSQNPLSYAHALHKILPDVNPNVDKKMDWLELENNADEWNTASMSCGNEY